MPVTMLPRSAWTSMPRPVGKLTPNNPALLRGFAVHYTGSTSPFGSAPTLAQSCARLEAERAQHVNDNGWTDIAYLAAVDQAGRLFDCRGADWETAANGDQTVNHQYGAITWLGGVGDTPTQAALDAIRAWRTDVWLPRWPHATAVVGHRDLHQTDCPGTPMYQHVTSGSLLASLEDDMAITDADLAKIADIVETRYQVHVGKVLETRDQAIGDIYAAVQALPGSIADAVAAKLAGTTQPATTGGLTKADVKAAVAEVFHSATA